MYPPPLVEVCTGQLKPPTPFWWDPLVTTWLNLVGTDLFKTEYEVKITPILPLPLFSSALSHFPSLLAFFFRHQMSFPCFRAARFLRKWTFPSAHLFFFVASLLRMFFNFYLTLSLGCLDGSVFPSTFGSFSLPFSSLEAPLLGKIQSQNSPDAYSTWPDHPSILFVYDVLTDSRAVDLRHFPLRCLRIFVSMLTSTASRFPATFVGIDSLYQDVPPQSGLRRRGTSTGG